ncbi:MAG: dihydrofolate reductase [Raineya sp.]
MTALVVAVSENNVIGEKGKIPWKLSDDLHFFKTLTENHVIIMGRKTFESLPKKLPNRIHVVVSRNKKYDIDEEDCYVVTCLDEALDFAKTFLGKKIFVIGGSKIYEQALQKKVVDTIFFTQVKAQVQGDTFFPKVEWQSWQEVGRKHFYKSEKNQYDFDIIEFKRKEI